MKTLQYEIKVDGLIIDGHPHQLFFSNFDAAARQFDKLVEKYPFYDVILSKVEKVVMHKRAKLKKPLVCPRGHSGTTDGKSVIVEGSDGKAYCTICGARGQ